jgi:peptidoglycan hydrolase-like protein with peptidoglycan-binding domain
MKRILGVIVAISLFTSAAAFSADENVRAAQSRLKETGFYFAEPTGNLDNDTSAALSRYQIRNGLPITGQLDAETAKSLGVKVAAAPAAAPAADSGSWQRLRKTDRQFLERREATNPTRNTGRAASGPAKSTPPRQRSNAPAESGAPATAPATRSAPAPAGSDYDNVLVLSRERLRDYVGAFVLAGLDPRVGAELEFFGDRVAYYNQGTVGREKIRADLQRYNQQWPQRRFWLAGEVDVEPQADSRVRVTFPLRYELRNGARRSSGRVRKTLLLEVVGDDLQIVSVNERKMR